MNCYILFFFLFLLQFILPSALCLLSVGRCFPGVGRFSDTGNSGTALGERKHTYFLCTSIFRVRTVDPVFRKVFEMKVGATFSNYTIRTGAFNKSTALGRV